VSAREEVLRRITAAHRSAPPPDLLYGGISRDYRTTSDLEGDQLVELLVDRLLDYKALVRLCSPDAVNITITEALTARGIRSVVVAQGLDDRWLTGLGTEVVRDSAPGPDSLAVSVLEEVDGVLTSCALAVAETGTLILDGSAGQGRRVITLIPDYHLCVVFADQITADVPQAVARLDLTRPITMISGPSATSDIELNRVEGVHGPRTLEVLIVNAPHTTS
jgi:L-lactate dehydrogenase complex protein LldG